MRARFLERRDFLILFSGRVAAGPAVKIAAGTKMRKRVAGWTLGRDGGDLQRVKKDGGSGAGTVSLSRNQKLAAGTRRGVKGETILRIGSGQDRAIESIADFHEDPVRIPIGNTRARAARIEGPDRHLAVLIRGQAWV